MDYTPGPWRVSGKQIKAVSHGTFFTIAETAGNRLTNEGHQANAKLIASAPELLEALKECVKVYQEHRDATPTGHLWPDPNHIFHAKAVINKATNL